MIVRSTELAGAVPARARANCGLRLSGQGQQIIRPSQDHEDPLLPSSGLLTIQTVALVLSVSTKTVRRLITRGQLQIVRIGRSVRIKPEILRALIEKGAR